MEVSSFAASSLYVPQGLNLLPMSSTNRRNSTGLKLQDVEIYLLVSSCMYNKVQEEIAWGTVWKHLSLEVLKQVRQASVRNGLDMVDAPWEKGPASRIHEVPSHVTCCKPLESRWAAWPWEAQKTWPYLTMPYSLECSLPSWLCRITASPHRNRNFTFCVVLLLLLNET